MLKFFEKKFDNFLTHVLFLLSSAKNSFAGQQIHLRFQDSSWTLVGFLVCVGHWMAHMYSYPTLLWMMKTPTSIDTTPTALMPWQSVVQTWKFFMQLPTAQGDGMILM
jgi:hypothetical protein